MTWLGEPFKAGRSLVCLVTFLAIFAAGCWDSNGPAPTSIRPPNEDFPVEVTAANGKIAISRRPGRIVSLSPTATEILFAIGAGSQVVAVDEESSYPANAPRTKLSGYTPNLEAIATYRPDLVVFSNEPGNLGTSLNAIGVPGILQPAAEQLDDTYSQILQLGLATGRQPQAERVVEEMKMLIKRIVRSLPRLPRSVTYYHELDESYYSATSKTFIGEVYGLLGLTNIADAADKLGSGYPQLSGEFIIQNDPDLIFLADTRCCGQSATTVAKRPGWEQIEAVRKGRVIELDDDIASRWGPRTVDFVRSVAHNLKSFEPQIQ